MLGLPLATHRSLLEPLTGEKHIKLVLIKRFLGFMDSIKNSKKAALQLLAKEASRDVRSITGCNLRNITLLLGETEVENILMVIPLCIPFYTVKKLGRLLQSKK